MTEKQFQQMVLDLCAYLGLRWYHTHDSRRSVAGFPDLVIVGKAAMIYVELKSRTGRLSDAQKTWLADLEQAGQRTYVWRPDDIYEARDVLTALARGSLST